MNKRLDCFPKPTPANQLWEGHRPIPLMAAPAPKPAHNPNAAWTGRECECGGCAPLASLGEKR